jgi:hypothetical protein
MLKYSEDQPRDETGKWSSVGGLGITAVRSGGFSVGHGGLAPKTGWMVSQKGTEMTRPLEALSAEGGKMTWEGQTVDMFKANVARFVGEFRAAHSDALAAPDVYLGGWVDTGVLYLDVSENIQDDDEATAAARENEQKAIYDAGTGEYKVMKAKPVEKVYVKGDASDSDIAEALIEGLGLGG